MNRMEVLKMMNEITVALGGGGIKGIAHIGVLRVLEKAGYKIKSVAGTSAGGIVGALYAAGYTPADIEQMVISADQKGLFKRSDHEGPSLLGLSGLTDILTNKLSGLTFDDLRLSFACTSVDLVTAQEIILTKGNVVDAVLATIAIPGVFPPKELAGCLLVDGGVMDPVPSALARYLNPTLPVVAVCLSPSPENWSQLPSIQLPGRIPIPAPIINQITRLRISQAMKIFVKSMDISSKMMAELRLQADKPEIIIRPNVIKYGPLDEVDPADLLQLGEAAALHALPAIEELFSLRQRLTRRFLRGDPQMPGKEIDPSFNPAEEK